MSCTNLIERVRQLSDPLTVTAAAKIVGVSEHTIYRLIDRGELSSFRILTAVRIEPEDLATYLESVRERSAQCQKG